MKLYRSAPRVLLLLASLSLMSPIGCGNHETSSSGNSPNTAGGGPASGASGGAGTTGTGGGGGTTGGGTTGNGPSTASFIYAVSDGNYYVFGGVLHSDGSITPIANDAYNGTGGFTTSIAADRLGHFVFVSSEGFSAHGTVAAQPALVSFTINRSNGSLTRNTPLQMLSAPIAADPNGRFVYMPTGSQTAGSQLDVFAVDQQSGALQRVSGAPFTGPMGERPLVNSAGTRLFSLDGQLGIASWQLNPQNGTAAPVPGSPFAISNLPPSDSPFSTSALSATLTPDERMLLVFTAPPFAILSMKVNEDGSLTRSASTSTQSQALSIAVEPSQRFVYTCGVVPSGPYQLDGYALDSSGRLTPLPGTPFHTGYCGSLTVHPSGQYLYSEAITFLIDRNTGTLTKIGDAAKPHGFWTVLTP